MTILIADDHATNLKLLRALLEAEGHRVLPAADGAEALEILHRQKVDAVISDILMPRMDGYRLCLELRKNQVLRGLPFIFYTSTYTSPADEKTALAMGADKFLKKPASALEIIAALQNAATTPRSHPPVANPSERELGLVKEYNERLVAKLEKKNLELEEQTESLRQSDSFSRAILASALDCIVVTDFEGVILEFNPAAEQTFGYKREELIGANLLQKLITRGSRPECACEFEAAHSESHTARRRRFEAFAHSQNAHKFPIELTITKILGTEPLKFAVFIRDITEQKVAEQRLVLQAAALQNAANAIMITDRQGKIVWTNPAFSVLTGYALEEVFTKNPRVLKSGAHDRPFYAQLWKTILAGRTWKGEFINRRKDGSLYCGEQTITPVATRPDRITHFIGIMSDVTERRRAQDDLRKSREQLRALTGRLQEAREEERIRISREMHDGLGETLTGIEIGLALIQSGFEQDQLPPRQELVDKLSGIRSLCGQTAGLVRKLCTELRPPLLDHLGLVPAIEWQLDEFQSRTNIRHTAKLELENATPKGEHATAFFRIFQEILTNVARHSRASKVKVLLNEDGPNVILQVTDNGKGIQSGELNGSKSLGILGMRERAGLLGGTVHFEGEPGKGTKVTVTIPVPGSASEPIPSTDL